QIMQTSEAKAQYADATQKARVGTVSGLLVPLWNHMPQPSELLEQKRIARRPRRLSASRAASPMGGHRVREQPDGLRVIDALMIFRENIRSMPQGSKSHALNVLEAAVFWGRCVDGNLFPAMGTKRKQ
ncbi:unnamed protein product, partial [Effrenium voratum]